MWILSRLRDYMDLFMIASEKNLDFSQLRLDAKTKFDWDIDVLQLGSQLLKVTERKDIPKLMEDFDYENMELYFKKIAASFKKEILR